ncbi:MAG: DUF3147 family protein [Candidatus Hydrogenedentes bacterium]|nr:DUF3147 family protein [Candidatus Hydrogenedentota bacterium]
MNIFIKAMISLAIILLCTGIGKKVPSLAGLIAVMPLTGALVLVWLYVDTGGSSATMQKYVTGALWGILPSILFFLVAFLCFRKRLALPMVLSASFGVWLLGALVHQWFFK